MSKRYLVIPSTRKKVYEGDVITLARLPGTKWVAEFGWYTYYNYQYSGWYLTGIPDGEVMPLNDEDLDEITIISTNSSEDNCNCNRPQPFPPDGGKHLGPGPNLDRAWISVDTIAQRDRLSHKPLPDGKIVRVNRTTNDGDPKYFVWNAVTESWDDFSFIGDEVQYLTRGDVLDLLQEKEIQKSLIQTIQEQIESQVPDIVDNKLKGINKDVNDLTKRVEELEEADETSNLWSKLT